MFRPATVAAIAMVFASAPGHGFCALEPGEEGRVVEVVDGDTLTLDSGLTVRLIGALAPAPPLDEATRKALEAATEGRTVRLFYGGRRRDRHGRALAHGFVAGDAGRLWLQGHLVGAGLATAYSFADNRACAAELLARENVARTGGLGLWGDGSLAVADGLDLEALIAAEHRFGIVEGTVHGAAEVRGRVYLNFEADWRADFTVSIAPRHRRAFDRHGIDLLALAGRRIRVRGWLTRRNGPTVEADHAEQVEILE